MKHDFDMSHDSTRSNDHLHIRDACPDELDEVSQLLKDAYRQYQSSIPSRVWETYLEDIVDVRGRLENAELLVAELDGRLVGTVTLYLRASDSSGEGWPGGWAGIRLLAAHPAYRNRGIGHALMEECVRRCRRQGITTIGLHTTELMDIARRMYERIGFVRAPEFDFYPRPGVTVMAYRLDLKY
ncbi:MAG: GNAT family N-acetyltransferase [Dehalococcoidales bacterium]|nr:GNAT family N-acetyltransferase [Dehalococcoidales bacterium]